jgi:hypothetical protein
VKKLVILVAVLTLISSCNVDESTRSACYVGDVLHFFSEEELFDYVRNEHSEHGETLNAFDERDWRSPDARTHYYKLASPPPGAIIQRITLGPAIAVVYDTQKPGVSEIEEHMMIQYGILGLYDIESQSSWVDRRFPEESYVFDLNGIKYYIRKVTAGDYFLWSVEWVNADGYNVYAQFPYRFTPEEVLGYISNIERVEIRSAGDVGGK